MSEINCLNDIKIILYEGRVCGGYRKKIIYIFEYNKNFPKIKYNIYSLIIDKVWWEGKEGGRSIFRNILSVANSKNVPTKKELRGF